jgi:hypothetical protein
MAAGDEEEHRTSTSKNRELEMTGAEGGRRESIYARTSSLCLWIKPGLQVGF